MGVKGRLRTVSLFQRAEFRHLFYAAAMNVFPDVRLDLEAGSFRRQGNRENGLFLYRGFKGIGPVYGGWIGQRRFQAGCFLDGFVSP